MRLSQRFPVETFIGLTLLLTFAAYLLPLPSTSKPILYPVVVTFIPTLVATLLSAVAGGNQAIKILFTTVRPGRLEWLAISILLGAGMQFTIALLAFTLRYSTTLRLTPSPQLVALAVITPILALGEELGWRGYALSKLLKTNSPLAASLITGIPWALVHLALYLPGMMFIGRPLIAQILPIAFFSILHAWVFIKSGGSILAPTFLHGAFNFLGSLMNADLPVIQATYLGAVVLVGSALIVVVAKPAFWLQIETKKRTGEYI
ncbi:MAG: CPBP family intramembrane metalloprotease [Anaerolineales bacterium]|nr:MAG: CPBP family intramembrane metalloprotease [Anaerolineales bacterium]